MMGMGEGARIGEGVRMGVDEGARMGRMGGWARG